MTVHQPTDVEYRFITPEDIFKEIRPIFIPSQHHLPKLHTNVVVFSRECLTAEPENEPNSNCVLQNKVEPSRTRTMFYIIRHGSSSVRFNFTFKIKSVRFGLCLTVVRLPSMPFKLLLQHNSYTVKREPTFPCCLSN